MGNRKDASKEETSVLVGDNNSRRIRPNDTIVIPAEFGGWNELGFIPDAPAEMDIASLTASATKAPDADQQKGSDPAHTAIDVADRAFCQSRARTILRVHPKLRKNAGDLLSFFNKLLEKLKDRETDLTAGVWKELLGELGGELASPDEHENASETATTKWNELRIERLRSLPGKLARYPGGVAWTTGLHDKKDRAAGMPPMPLVSFGDDDDSLTQTGRVKLLQHLADVHDEVCRLTGGTSLSKRIEQGVSVGRKVSRHRKSRSPISGNAAEQARQRRIHAKVTLGQVGLSRR